MSGPRRAWSRPAATFVPALDLRLVPLAGVTWLVCLGGIHAPSWLSAAVAIAVVTGALGLQLNAVLRAGRRASRTPARRRPRRLARSDHPLGPGARHRGAPSTSRAASVRLALLTTAVAATVVAVQVDLRDDALARLPERGSIEAVVRIGSDPAPAASESLDGSERWVIRGDLISAQVRGRERLLDLPVTLFAPASWSELPIGQTVTARVVVRPTERGDSSAAVVVPREAPQTRSPPTPHLRFAGTLRETLRTTVADFPDHARGLVPGIAVGDDRAVPAELEDALRVTGLTHLTAVSGAHVALVLAPILLATGRFRPGLRVGVTAFALLALVVLVRPDPSVIRAAVMGAVTIGALLTGRPAAAPSSLALAVTVLLLHDPWLAVRYGFVLSVLATGALCLLAPRWTRGLARLLPRPLAAAIATTSAAQLVCTPVLILLQPQVSLLAVPANMLAAPAVAPVTFLGLGATLIGPVHPGAAHVLAVGASVGTGWIAQVALTLANLPGASLPWIPGAPGAVLAAALAALIILGTPVLLRRTMPAAARLADSLAHRLDRGGNRPHPHAIARGVGGDLPARSGSGAAVVGALAGLALLLLTLVLPVPPFGREKDVDAWDLLQCDVGQGAAMLVRTGPDAAIVLDAGPPAGTGRGETPTGGIARCLRDAGIDRVPLLVLTHTHLDHAGGVQDLLGAAAVDSAVVGPGPRRDTILSALTAQGATILEAEAGTGLTVGDVQLDVLQGSTTQPMRGPSQTGREPARESEEDVNAHSLVLLATLPGGVTALTAGDLGEADQSRLLRAARRAEPGTAATLLGGVDIVSVPHHGSADQSAALAAVLAPRLALVSVGDNDYGHPTASALALYDGATVRRSDECGDTRVLIEPAGEGATGGARSTGSEGLTGNTGGAATLRLVDRCS